MIRSNVHSKRKAALGEGESLDCSDAASQSVGMEMQIFVHFEQWKMIISHGSTYELNPGVYERRGRETQVYYSTRRWQVLLRVAQPFFSRILGESSVL